jgi:non-ribosomal peptide synthetase component F
MEPSHDLVVALLGVLKAGAAFLPLDSALPQARLGFMIRDSRAAVLLTRERESKQFPGGPARVIRRDT